MYRSADYYYHTIQDNYKVDKIRVVSVFILLRKTMRENVCQQLLILE